MKGEGIFSVNLAAFHDVCSLGMVPACLYLVYARGTGKANTESSWSRKALTKYTSITRGKAKIAQDVLLDSGLVEQQRGGKNPKFKLIFEPEGEKVWLPNSFVTLIDECALLERIRQTGDVQCLRLLVDCYAVSNIADEGGVPYSAFYDGYTKTKIAESGQFDVWGFNQDTTACYTDHRIVAPHVTPQKESDGNGLRDFFDRVRTLKDVRALEKVPVLFDAKDGQVIAPLICPFDHSEIIQFREAAENALPEFFVGELDQYEWVVALPRHLKNSVLRSHYFQTNRQNTELMTAAYAVTKNRIASWINVYHEDKLLYQGEINGLSKGNQW